MPANPIPLNATARTWVATRVRRLEGAATSTAKLAIPQLVWKQWCLTIGSDAMRPTCWMARDRSVMVLAQSLGDADRQASRDEKGDRGPGTPVGCDHAPHMG
jgi:hypothetical protein